MRSILNDFLTKIKVGLDSLNDKKEQILLSFVIVFVALSSFALGRYSVEDHTDIQSGPSSTKTGNYQTKIVKENNPSSASGSFVASKSGTKYYLLSCSGVSKISEKNKIYFKAESEAQNAGYSRASNCNF